MHPHALDEYLSDVATTDGMPERPDHHPVPTTGASVEDVPAEPTA